MSEPLSTATNPRRGTPKDRDAIADAYLQAFGFNAARSSQYIDAVGPENFRLVMAGDELAAVMAVIDTAHWMGGQAVRAVNVAHVAINPAWRGAGLAGRFLDTVCAEARADGIGLATLFASTRPVYRRAGFALAGLEMIYEAETSALPRARGGSFSQVRGSAIADMIYPLYDRMCLETCGPLRRSPAHWAGILGGDVSIYVSRQADAPAYIVLDTTDPECLVVRDWVALNGAAATQLMSFAGTFASVYPRIRWHGSPQDALVFAMPDKGWRLLHQEEWLAKVLDPRVALAQRGYGADGAINFELSAGETISRFALTIRGGKGKCGEAAADLPTLSLRLDDLGTLLTGHRSAQFLRRAGLLSGDTAAMRLWDAAVAGPAPWVGEHF